MMHDDNIYCYLERIDSVLREKIDKLDNRLSTLEALECRAKAQFHVFEKRLEKLEADDKIAEKVINDNFKIVMDDIKYLSEKNKHPLLGSLERSLAKLGKSDKPVMPWYGAKSDLTFEIAMAAAKVCGKLIKRKSWSDCLHYFYENGIFKFSQEEVDINPEDRVSPLTLQDINAKDWMIIE